MPDDGDDEEDEDDARDCTAPKLKNEADDKEPGVPSDVPGVAAGTRGLFCHTDICCRGFTPGFAVFVRLLIEIVAR